MTTRLDYRCLANRCTQATQCRRYLTGAAAKNSPAGLASFDARDKPDGQCDGFLPRIMEPIRVESEGGDLS